MWDGGSDCNGTNRARENCTIRTVSMRNDTSQTSTKPRPGVAGSPWHSANSALARAPPIDRFLTIAHSTSAHLHSCPRAYVPEAATPDAGIQHSQSIAPIWPTTTWSPPLRVPPRADQTRARPTQAGPKRDPPRAHRAARRAPASSSGTARWGPSREGPRHSSSGAARRT